LQTPLSSIRERTPVKGQVDFFLDALVDAPIKEDRALLEFPFFSLAKRPRMEPIVYSDSRVSIEVAPSHKGVATVWDRDVLIYLTSLINERMERGEPVSRTVRFPAHDFLIVTRRAKPGQVGAKAYDAFLDALERLRGTTVKTSISAAEVRERRGFGWIDNFRVVEVEKPGGKRRMKAVEVTLNDWTFRAITKERRVLTVNRDYFQLTGGIERRLYELARKHCGDQASWSISLPRLAEKVGVSGELRKFKAELKDIIARDNLPDYRYGLARDPSGEMEKGMKAEGYSLKGLRNDRVLAIVTPKFKVKPGVGGAEPEGSFSFALFDDDDDLIEG